MSAELLREAAALMRTRAGVATDGGHGWRVADHAGANEVWADRDTAGWDAFMVATTATRLNPNPGVKGHDDAAHIASWHPAVALAVADWLDGVAERHAPTDNALNVGQPCCQTCNLDLEDDERGHCEDFAQALAAAAAYLGRSA